MITCASARLVVKLIYLCCTRGDSTVYVYYYTQLRCYSYVFYQYVIWLVIESTGWRIPCKLLFTFQATSGGLLVPETAYRSNESRVPRKITC